MNCVDIVIGTARGTQFRVFDYYTRDRSTPLFDEMYGGTQGITAAIGKEVDGITTIKFRKSLTSGKSNIATCIIIFYNYNTYLMQRYDIHNHKYNSIHVHNTISNTFCFHCMNNVNSIILYLMMPGINTCFHE